MSDLTGRTQNDTYKDLLHFENSNLGFDGTLRQIESGNGVGSTLSLSTIGAAIAGTLTVAGVASFTVDPNVGGNVMWHAGNDGAGSGLDADTLQGNFPSAFLTDTSTPTLSGIWTFNERVSLNRANNLELLRFNDDTNVLQMRAIFTAGDLDWSLQPGTGGIFDATASLFYDSSLDRWSVNTDFAINKINGKLYINTAGGQVPVMSVETTLGDGVLLGDPSFDTFMTSTDGIFHVLGNTTTQFNGGFELQDGAVLSGRVGFFADTGDAFVIENELPIGDILITSFNGFVDLRSDLDDVIIAAGAFMDISSEDEMSLASTFGILIEAGTDVQIDNVNGLAFTTDDYTALTSTSSAIITDGLGNNQNVGFNAMPSIDFAVATSLLSANVGFKLNFTGAATVPLTVSGDANIPVGASWVLANVGTSVFTMATTGITLNWLDGGGVAAPTGTRTVAIAGIATVTKRATGVYDIWGAGLT